MELVVPRVTTRHTRGALFSSKTLDRFLTDYSRTASIITYRDITVETHGKGSVLCNGHTFLC